MRTTVCESGTEAHLEAAPSSLPARWDLEISASADRMAERMRRGKYVILFLFSILYFAVTCLRASQKLFWFDELFTLYISRLPDMASVWNALKHGVDFNPPLFYLLTRFSESLFGEGQIAARLPEIVGFGVFCLCLFQFVSTRTSVLAGSISMLFPMVTTAYYYAYEARAHGIVLGFGGIALVCWQAAFRSGRRAWWLGGLSLTLLCAILTHTYAVLLLVPFAVAEIVRMLPLRRIDWIVWLAIVTPLFGTLVSLPLFRASQSVIPNTAFRASLYSMVNSYQSHLAPALGVIAVWLVLYFAFTYAWAQPQTAPDGESTLEPPESAVLIAFVAMPFFLFVLASLTGAPYMDRYSISAVAGFGCLLGIVAAKRPTVGLGVLVFLVAQIGLNFLQYAVTGTVVEPITHTVLSPKATLARAYEAMETGPDKHSPIVLLDNLEFLPIMHYAPPDIASRLVYSAPEFDLNGEGYTRLQRCCRAPGRFESLADLRSTGGSFPAFSSSRSLYQLDYFIHEGADVRLEAALEGGFLATVTFKGKQTGSAIIPLR
jgi:hypothetical protein